MMTYPLNAVRSLYRRHEYFIVCVLVFLSLIYFFKTLQFRENTKWNIAAFGITASSQAKYTDRPTSSEYTIREQKYHDVRFIDETDSEFEEAMKKLGVTPLLQQVPKEQWASEKRSMRHARPAHPLDKKYKSSLKDDKIINVAIYNLKNTVYFTQNFSDCECESPDGLNCIATSDTDAVSTAEVVIFFVGINNVSHTLPRNLPLAERPGPQQKWVYYQFEPPYRSTRHLTEPEFRYAFNYTMTYSMYSDIPMPYGRCTPLEFTSQVERREHERQVSNTKFVRHRTKLVAWFASRCDARSRRADYIKVLQNYIPVDIYGACGELTCPKDTQRDCEEMLASTYKFYMAFENNLCSEYITEKTWRSFELGLVPVVYGAPGNYEHILPVHSYINVADFESPKHLAEYMVRLDRYDYLYNEYFAWKKKFNCGKYHFRDNFCSVCRYLHQTRTQRRVLDLHHFHRPDWDCIESEDYLNKVLGVK